MVRGQLNLFGEPKTTVASVSPFLDAHHYLGPSSRGTAYSDDFGVMVFAGPTSRRLPTTGWIELVRWCLNGEKNAGSRQWKAARKWLLESFQALSTVVSYSDPAVGHTGALYRACGWLWAPTWHRLRPPPSGNGAWTDGCESVKDRWVYPLRFDPVRAQVLALQDESLRRRFPWAEYTEPRWKGSVFYGGGADYKRWFAPASEPSP